MSRIGMHVDHVTRLQGHGNIIASLSKGRVGQVALQVIEALRFAEAALHNQPYGEVAHIASSICSMCTVSHSCASLQATEAALGIGISEQTTLLRRLIMNAEIMSSHALHVYFLAAPDFRVVDGLIPLVPENRELLKRAFRLKQAAYELSALIGGHDTRPISLVPGGFAKLPTMAQLGRMEKRLIRLRDDVQYAVELYQSFEIPDFERPTQYVCLKQPDHYGFYGGELITSDGRCLPTERYVEAIQEHVVPDSAAKHAKWRQSNYMVGALARVNNKWDQLYADAQDAAEVLGLTPPCTNPFMNTAAQVVEVVHCLEESIWLIDQILSYGPNEEPKPVIAMRGSRGVGIVDAPRGPLLHEYTYDDEGRTIHVNILTPIMQNLGNLDADMGAYLARLKEEPQDEIHQRMAMLVRAYDPCVCCSTRGPARGATSSPHTMLRDMTTSSAPPLWSIHSCVYETV
jgi:sulfhydrogenase subunit alpha